MKVLVVSRCHRAYPTPRSGCEEVARRQAESLAKSGVDVSLLGQGNLPESMDGLQFLALPSSKETFSRSTFMYFVKGLVLSVAAGLAASKLSRRSPRPAIVHFHSNVSLLTYRLFGRNASLVYTIHDPLFSRADSENKWIRVVTNLILERLAVRNASHVIAVSPDILQSLLRWGVSPSQLSMILPMAPVCTEIEAPSTPKPTSAERDQPPPHYLVTVGDLVGRKRTDLLIQAMVGVPLPFGLKVVGSGPKLEAYARESASLGLSDRVSFLQNVPAQELTELYRNAAVCVLASDREGFPASFVEALSAGTRCLLVRSLSAASAEPLAPYIRVFGCAGPSDIARVLVEEYLSEPSASRITRSEVERWASEQFETPERVAVRLREIYQGSITRRVHR